MRIFIKKNLKWIILFFIFWTVAFRLIPGEFIDLGGDSAQYIILAEGINQGKWLKAVNLPGEPYYFYYPPVFSLLLFPIIHFFGRNFFLMYMFVASLGCLSLCFIYNIFKESTSKNKAFFITVIFASNFIFIFYATREILSDVPYLFMSSLALFFAARFAKQDSALNREGVFTVLLLTLSYFTRYSAIALALGITLSILASGQKFKIKKASFIFLGFFVPFLLWQLISKFFSAAQSPIHYNQLFLIDPYRPFLGNIVNHPGQILSRFIQGVNYYYSLVGQSISIYSMIKWRIFAEAFCFISFLLIFMGFFLEFRKNKGCVFQYYFLLYFLLIVFWPFREGMRFILPILPFIIFYFFSGLMAIFSRLSRRVSLALFSFFVCLLLFFNLANLLHSTRNLPTGLDSLPAPLQNFINLNNWVKFNLSDNAYIVSRKPTLTYFYTGHKSTCYPFSLNPQEIWQYIEKGNFRYIIIDEFSRESYYYLVPFIQKYKGRLKPLKRIGNTGIFEVSG